jgi:hypothetical protein
VHQDSVAHAGKPEHEAEHAAAASNAPALTPPTF